MVIEQEFRKAFGDNPEVVVRAPGRVNLIGEHTDYNQGFVLPAAIDRYCWYAGRRVPGSRVDAYSVDFQKRAQFDLGRIERDGADRWSDYLRGVSKLLQESGAALNGAEIVLGGDVPREAGLSSSAAVEIAAAAFWNKLLGLKSDPVGMVKLAQKAENDFVGIPCGIMDQFVSALGRKDHALFLDCRDLTYKYVPLGGSIKIVVCNSGVKRTLAKSEYETRTRQCADAVARLRSAGLPARSLRDVSLADLAGAKSALDGVLLRRARHVMSENDRVLRAVNALEQGDLTKFGKLMNESHASLRDDYEVSSPELDALVEIAQKQPGALGARMTGAGFGGCTVNLVSSENAAAFADAVRDGYRKAMGHDAEVYTFQASDGAMV